MNSLFPINRMSRRLTCTWVLTGDQRMPLKCVWSLADNSRTASTALPSSNLEAEGLRRCA